MDWFTWLSKTGLDPSLVYEYGLTFAHNELEEDDICYFNHEFLQSMGISIAKHRLEIIKLARKQKGDHISNGRNTKILIKLVSVLKKTKRCLAKHIRTWVRRDHDDSGALIVVNGRHRSYGNRWRGAMVKRNKRLTMVKQGKSTLMLMNGSAAGSTGNTPARLLGGGQLSNGASPRFYDVHDQYDEDGGADDDGYWSACTAGTAVEEIRWDAMFQDLKPT